MIVGALVILGPLLAALAIVALRRAATWLALAGVSVSFAAALVTLVRVADGGRFSASLPGLPGRPLRLVATPLTAALAMTVATVGLLVLVYAVGYMRGEEGQARFFAEMAFFVGAMQVVALAGDWILFLAGWELIGLASYLLIGFWHERPGVPTAASRAFLVTRAADVGLYVGAFILIDRAGTTAIDASLATTGTTATVASLFLLLAAMGKAAQVPLQGWLQDAMVGPTPVSALLHAATLVVAGVILMARAFPLLPSDVRLVVGLVGGLTAVVAGLTALAQGDLKRVLASSTSSQLGLMLLGLGAGSVGAAIFHLVTNAAIKSSLFLGAGIFQHARGSTDFDDLALIGRQRRRTFAAFVLAALALAGVPPLAAFWSKDAIIAASVEGPSAWLLAALGLLATLLTGVYSARAVRLLWGGPGGARPASRPVHGLGWMGAGLAGLVALAAGLGVVQRPLGRLLDAQIPADLAGLALGLGLTAVGLTTGWWGYRALLLGPAQSLARRGFRLGDGWAGLVARPALALARACDRLDAGVHATVLGVGRLGRGMAAGADLADARIQRVVAAAGRGGLSVASLTRIADDEGIERLIERLVTGTRRLGGQARRLQSGLVHRELAVAAGGTLLVLLVILLR